jgi:hypothetical protein
MGSNEGASKGPSSDDPGIEGAFRGGDGGPATAPMYDFPALVAESPGLYTNADALFGAPNDIGWGTTPLVGIGGTFSVSDGAAPYAPSSGSTSGNAPWSASLANPSGISFGGGQSAAGSAPVTAAPPGSFNYSTADLTGGGIGSDYAASMRGGPAAAAPSGAMTPEQLGQKPALTARPQAAASGGGGEQSILEALGASIAKNPMQALQTAVGIGGLAYSGAQGQKTPAYSPELAAQAARLDQNGQQLLTYLQDGNLPPGLKASLDQATAAAKARMISNFAAQGLNTDPTQNSVLAAQLAQVDQQALITTAQIGQQLMQSGMAQTGLASDLYKTLANIDQTQTAAIGKSISNFAAALGGGGGKGLNLRLG